MCSIWEVEKANKPEKVVWQDNAGENIQLQDRRDQVAWNQYNKFTKDTSQQNYLAELGITTIAARTRAVRSSANLNQEPWLLLWKMSFQTATELDNLTIIYIFGDLKTRHEHLGENFLKSAGSFKHLAVSTAKIGKDGEIEGHEAPCMFADYFHDHDGNWYWMYNPKTKW